MHSICKPQVKAQDRDFCAGAVVRKIWMVAAFAEVLYAEEVQLRGLDLTNDVDWSQVPAHETRAPLKSMNSTTSVCFLRRASHAKRYSS